MTAFVITRGDICDSLLFLNTIIRRAIGHWTDNNPFIECLEPLAGSCSPLSLLLLLLSRGSASLARGNVWLRGRLVAELIDGRRERTVGVKGLPDIRGEVGLARPADNDGIVSRDVVLWEWLWAKESREKSWRALSLSSFLRVSLLAVGERGDRVRFVGEMGEMLTETRLPVGDRNWDTLSESLKMVSVEFFRDLDGFKLFFCLNFSSQLALNIFCFPSGLAQVVAKKCAFSLIIASVRVNPCRW